MHQFFKYMLLVTLVVFSLYLLALGLSYFIGPVAFDDFKTHILPFGYFLPFVLIISFLGRSYFRQSDWLQESNRKMRRGVFYFWVGLNVAAIAVVYFIFLSKPQTVLVAGTNVTKPVKTSRPAARVNEASKKMEKPEVTNLPVDEAKQTEDALAVAPVTEEAIDVATEEVPKERKRVLKGKRETAYKPIAKAYFYEEPDEKTQRKVFLQNHPAAAPLKSREEKNGFVYVIVQDRRGTPTVGWLQKKDLKPVDMFYNDGKE